MDEVKATAWEGDLKGKQIAGFTVENLIDYGKSAAVFRATKAEQNYALKIFDDELIEKYGDKTQLARIDRELTLVGKKHPNMVQIIDGGFDETSGNHFIVMEYLPGPSLEKCLQDVPEENVPQLIEQLASCCEYLEGLDLVHRDIKPANIVIMEDYSRLVLLDFGVMKPVGEVGLTDAGGIQSFIGTLQYSSPEFLLRKEEDTTEGWRALTVYQIGGVLHDLIMRRPLFQDYANPYARLVLAVQNVLPTISSTTAPAYLIEACKAALVKDWPTRLTISGWKSFSPPEKNSLAADARERVTHRSVLNQSLATSEPSVTAFGAELLGAVIDLLKVEARRVRNGNSSALPPIAVARMPADGNVLTITFREAQDQQLSAGLSVEFHVQILDEASQAISLSVSAWTGKHLNRPGNAAQVAAFAGIFVPSALSSIIETTMYLAVDQAQGLGDEPGVAIDLQPLLESA